MNASSAPEGDFWQFLRRLIAENLWVIDRPKGSHHPRFPDLVYPLDYGYLDDTSAVDGGGIDVWLGSQPDRSLSGIACTIDLYKRDAELKILLGCTQEEIQTVLDFHNNSDSMRAIWIPCPKEAT
jgi:inorganic pyrophosphatase